LLLRYFGETVDYECGICSYCISQNKVEKEVGTLSEKIINALQKQELNSRDIQMITKYPTDDVIFALQNLLENDTIIVKPNNLYALKK
jgi:ATP-dependent DNA helicase RecQ